MSRPTADGATAALVSFLDKQESFARIEAVAQETEPIRARIAALRAAVASSKCSVAVIGNVKVGKSTLNNYLFCGAMDVLPSAVTPETAVRVRVEPFLPESNATSTGDFLLFGPRNIPSPSAPFAQQQASAMAVGPQQIQDTIRLLNQQYRDGELSAEFRTQDFVVRMPWKYSSGIWFAVHDLAGVNEAGQDSMRQATQEALQKADLILYVLDATQLGTTDEQRLLMDLCNCAPQTVRNIHRRGVFVINKCDRAAGDDPNRLRRHVHDVVKRVALVDDHPLELPMERIVAVSAGNAFFFGQKLAELQVGKLTDEGRLELKKRLYGHNGARMNPSDADLIARCTDLCERSGCPGLQRYIVDYLREVARPEFLINRGQECAEIASSLSAIFQCRQLAAGVSDADAQRLMNALEQLMPAQLARLDVLQGQFHQSQDEGAAAITQWSSSWRAAVDRLVDADKTPSTAYPSGDVANASARAVGSKLVADALMLGMQGKPSVEATLERCLRRCNDASCTELRAVGQAIVSTFPAAAAPMFNFSGAVTSLLKPVPKSVGFVSVNVQGSIDGAVSTTSRSVSKTVSVLEMVTEQYYETVYYDEHFSRKETCGGTKRWTERRSRQERRTREVPNYVNKVETSTVTDIVVNFPQLRNEVGARIRAEIDRVQAEYLESWSKSFQALFHEAYAAGVERIQHFVIGLKRDLVKNRGTLQRLLQSIQNGAAVVHNVQLSTERMVELLAPTEFPQLVAQFVVTTGVHDAKRAIRDPSAVERSPTTTRRTSLHDLCAFVWELLPTVSQGNADCRRLEALALRLSAACHPHRLLICGDMKAGKTTVENIFLGADILSSDVLPQTAVICVAEHVDSVTATISPTHPPVPLPALLRNVVPKLKDDRVPFLGSAMITKSTVRVVSGVVEVNRAVRELECGIRSKRDQGEVIPPADLQPIVLLQRFPFLCTAPGPVAQMVGLQLIDSPGTGEGLLAAQVGEASSMAADASDSVVLVVDATRLFQRSEGGIHDTLRGWVIEQLRQALGTPGAPLPLLVLVNKIDEAKRWNADAEGLRAKVHSFYIDWLSELCASSQLPISRSTLEETLFPKTRVVCTSAAVAMLSAVLDNGNLTMGTVQRHAGILFGESPLPTDDGQIIAAIRQAAADNGAGRLADETLTLIESASTLGRLLQDWPSFSQELMSELGTYFPALLDFEALQIAGQMIRNIRPS